MAFLMLPRRMGHDKDHRPRLPHHIQDLGEQASFQNEIVEASLAHVVGGKVEQAYLRGDMFEKRRRLAET